MAERSRNVDLVTIWRLVQRYAPELNRRCRPELRTTNRSWRVDETYLRVAGKWTYLYRAMDSTGATVDFLLSAKRDADAAKRFFQKALRSDGHPRPRVINVDGNPSYPKVIGRANDSGYRDGEHDPQGTSEVVGETTSLGRSRSLHNSSV